MKEELDLQKTNYENLASEHTQLKLQLEEMEMTNKGQAGLSDLLELQKTMFQDKICSLQ